MPRHVMGCCLVQDDEDDGLLCPSCADCTCVGLLLGSQKVAKDLPSRLCLDRGKATRESVSGPGGSGAHDRGEVLASQGRRVDDH
jgi:hypothetical protein